jgi:hypothetical protein
MKLTLVPDKDGLLEVGIEQVTMDMWTAPKSAGKLRGALAEKKAQEIRGQRTQAAKAIRRKPEFSAGTLSKEDLGTIWGTSVLGEYVQNFFAQYDVKIREDFKLECGKCLAVALSDDGGYISDEELRTAREHVDQVRQRRAQRKAEKESKKR